MSPPINGQELIKAVLDYLAERHGIVPFQMDKMEDRSAIEAAAGPKLIAWFADRGITLIDVA